MLKKVIAAAGCLLLAFGTSPATARATQPINADTAFQNVYSHNCLVSDNGVWAEITPGTCDTTGVDEFGWQLWGCNRPSGTDYYAGCSLLGVNGCLAPDNLTSGSGLHMTADEPCPTWEIYDGEGAHVIQATETNLCLQAYDEVYGNSKVRLATCGAANQGVPSEGWYWEGA
jgi:hypothetical protein